ncbi:5-oxoprolinase (ATP-hydrolyzing) (plasmid) [Thermus thermophilus SG0.5JP17-16]|uniref:5-oxoprolinase (ATP-hydrolyzing) n=1 Tax=Thermus thermophilus (strain SG0.5JP17-16) TaxID=762633 RepID=F6DIP1_THETG|nr:hydantoinase/oxoprolinase family protein [Thermus thermophilus]AEG34707.1 5-oxoprolinase (ATP-hydrolyzing) [Thermus thermophilus SG0.5JP17-16]
MAERKVQVAVDVGGTFTDLVALYADPHTGTQRVVTAKVNTTPPEFEKGVLQVLQKGGVPVGETALLIHGTTVVINAITERRGVKVGLITTEGFRDVLEIARGDRPDFFNLLYRKPPPFVPRYLRREVPGRMTYRGEERSPLDTNVLPGILEDFKKEGVEAVAVCLLHSYANPSHEERVVQEIRRLWPDVPVIASHEITREWREYERTSTTVLCAYVLPVAQRYLDRLGQGLADQGFGGQIYIMHSNGGVETLERTKRVPITMIESGPAGGFLGAAELGRLLGEPNILALDIGGTTAKCSLIVDGQVRIKTDYWIERDRKSSGYPIMVPVVDVVEIGNGGGSIAWVDDFGRLHVGPQSAGAQPGPAAYGRGGQDATTTDANLALGRINPNYFCGGEIEADMDAVNMALDRLSARLGMKREEVARGIIRLANNNMVNALKLVSVNRGYDPRDFTLMAFGGGGGMHAVALARELGMRKVIIPWAADVFSAFGMLMTDLRRDYLITQLISLDTPQAASRLSWLAESLTQTALEELKAEGVPLERARLLYFGRIRYENQEHTVEIPLPPPPYREDSLSQIAQTFHEAYEREYTYRLNAPLEFVTLHLVLGVAIDRLQVPRMPRTGRSLEEAMKGVRTVDFDLEGVQPAKIYDGHSLEPGMAFEGPAIVETKGTTVVVHPGCRAEVDDFGNLHIYL